MPVCFANVDWSCAIAMALRSTCLAVITRFLARNDPHAFLQFSGISSPGGQKLFLILSNGGLLTFRCREPVSDKAQIWMSSAVICARDRAR